MPDRGSRPLRAVASAGAILDRPSPPAGPGPAGPGPAGPGAGTPGAGAGGAGPSGADAPGDEAARPAAEVVAGLYADAGPAVLAYVTSLLGDRYLAEDVVQETMLRAWRHCGQLSEEKGSIRGWLLRVAHNIAMDKVRMRRSRPVEVDQAAAPEPQAGDHADAVVTAMHVRSALARLPSGHRAVLEQVYMNGLTAAEAAAVLGIPEGTVFSRAYYGLRMMRRHLAPATSSREVPDRGQAAA